MEILRHILRLFVVMLFSASGANMAFAVPMATSDISFSQAENTLFTQASVVLQKSSRSEAYHEDCWTIEGLGGLPQATLMAVKDCNSRSSGKLGRTLAASMNFRNRFAAQARAFIEAGYDGPRAVDGQRMFGQFRNLDGSQGQLSAQEFRASGLNFQSFSENFDVYATANAIHFTAPEESYIASITNDAIADFGDPWKTGLRADGATEFVQTLRDDARFGQALLDHSIASVGLTSFAHAQGVQNLREALVGTPITIATGVEYDTIGDIIAEGSIDEMLDKLKSQSLLAQAQGSGTTIRRTATKVEKATNTGALPSGYRELGSMGALGNSTGGLPTGYRRVVAPNGDVQVLAPDGRTYASIEHAPVGNRPPNLSPIGAGRSGAFNQAKQDAGIPTSSQPTRVVPNIDRQGNVQPGRVYEYDLPAEGGGTRTVRIRDDAGGHLYLDDPSQNRGAHFNTEDGGHYDY